MPIDVDLLSNTLNKPRRARRQFICEVARDVFRE